MYQNDPLSWLGTIKKEIQPGIIAEKADPDEVIAEIKEHWDAWFNQFLPGLFESRAFRNAISAMHSRSFTIKQAKGGHTIESRGLAAVVRAVLYRVPEGTKNRFATVRDLLAIADIEVTSKQVRDIETQR